MATPKRTAERAKARAIELTQKGYEVFPLLGGQIQRDRHWWERSTNDPEEVKKWDLQEDETNLAITCRALVVLSALTWDPREGKDLEGVADLKTLESTLGKLPESPIQLTWEGNEQHFFRLPADLEEAPLDQKIHFPKKDSNVPYPDNGKASSVRIQTGSSRFTPIAPSLYKLKAGQQPPISGREIFPFELCNGRDLPAVEDLPKLPEKWIDYLKTLWQVQQQTEDSEAIPTDLKNKPVSTVLEDLLNEFRAGGPLPLNTGFDRLDHALGGGLYPNLVILGAVPGLGKSTFALQVSDQVAAKGGRVLFFSLEMSRGDLVAKSLSRITGKHAYEQYLQPQREAGADYQTNLNKWFLPSVYSMRDIQRGDDYRKKHGFQQEENFLDLAIQEYRRTISRNITIVEAGEGSAGYTIEELEQDLLEQITSGRRPDLVVIDYLQLLTTEDNFQNKKQEVDQIILALVRIKRKHKIPILAISSFGRHSYAKEVGLDSFKESGGIEYSGEVVLGLQYTPEKLNGTTKEDREDEARKNFLKAASATERSVELVVIKNRNGQAGTKVSFSFFPIANYFTSKAGSEAENETKRQTKEINQKRLIQQRAREFLSTQPDNEALDLDLYGHLQNISDWSEDQIIDSILSTGSRIKDTYSETGETIYKLDSKVIRFNEEDKKD